MLLFVFVCQGVLGGQMKFFCVFGCVMVGWLAVSGVNDCFWGFWLAGWQFETRGMWLASRWGGGLLLCMRCGYGSIRFEDWLLVAAILVVSILMYK